MRLHRLIAIILLIESRGTVKAKELADALETSVRTVYRDIDILCESGIPITAATGPNGGIGFVEGYHINIGKLHCDDVINLFLCGIGIRPDEQSESSLRLKNALLKLEDSLPAQYVPDIKIAKERFFFDPTPWWEERTPVYNLDIIRRSVWQSKKLKIFYLKVNGESAWRVIHPYGLVVKTMDWYMVGYCESSGEIRTFRCDRMTVAQIVDEAFSYPEDFHLESYWTQSSNEFKETCREKEYYPVEIRLNVKNAALLKNYEVIDKRADGEIIYTTINLYSFEIAKLKVPDMIGRSEIITPFELRCHVKGLFNEIIKLYK